MTNLRLFIFLTALLLAPPEESRILQAPLAAEAGGWGLWPEGAWPSAAEPGYVRMRELVRGAIVPLEHHDLAGTCGRPDRCLCDCCWVRLRNGQDKVPGTADLDAGTRPSKGERQ